MQKSRNGIGLQRISTGWQGIEQEKTWQELRRSSGQRGAGERKSPAPHNRKGTTMTKIVLQMPKESAERLLADPEATKAFLKSAGFDVESVQASDEPEFELQGERVKRWAPKATKPKGPSLYDEAKEIGKAWNASGKLSPCVEFDATRLRALKSRLTSDFFRQHWREAIARLERSDFAAGHNDQQWKANVDWFLRPGNVERVMEGRYDNREKQFDRDKASVLRTSLLSLRRDLERLRDDMKYGATDAQKERATSLRSEIINIERKLVEAGEAV